MSEADADWLDCCVLEADAGCVDAAVLVDCVAAAAVLVAYFGSDFLLLVEAGFFEPPSSISL